MDKYGDDNMHFDQTFAHIANDERIIKSIDIHL